MRIAPVPAVMSIVALLLNAVTLPPTFTLHGVDDVAEPFTVSRVALVRTTWQSEMPSMFVGAAPASPGCHALAKLFQTSAWPSVGAVAATFRLWSCVALPLSSDHVLVAVHA